MFRGPSSESRGRSFIPPPRQTVHLRKMQRDIPFYSTSIYLFPLNSSSGGAEFRRMSGFQPIQRLILISGGPTSAFPAFQMEEHVNHLNENKDNKKARDGFIEATRALELMNFDEVEGLAETMFKGAVKF